MQPAIEVLDLERTFGTVRAVQGISFTVARGEVLGFLGPNGAGKSTTMKMIAGFLDPTSGTVRVLGHDVREAPLALKRAIGYLPEGAPGYGEMTARAFLEFVAEIRGIRGGERQRRIREVVAQIHLESVMERPIETLSKGFKRRVGVAQAILHDPEVLIMDEPTDGLDPNQKHEVRTLIEAMAPNKAIIISTHILEEVNAVCTRAIIIASGRLLFDGTPSELEQMSKVHNAVVLTLKSAAAQGAAVRLAELPGVAGVESLPSAAGTERLMVMAQNGSSIVTRVGDLARAEAWNIEELRVETGRLDEVFRTITLRDESGRERVRT